MARALNKLTVKQVESIKLGAGRHSDGGGLYLSVARGGSKSWTFFVNTGGKRKELGLGGFPTVSLADAREKAAAFRKIVAAGGDPARERQREQEKTFGEIFDSYIDDREHIWKNAVHRHQWRRSAEVECAAIRNKLISQIGQDEILSVLKPIWTTKAETASRLRGRLDLVLEFAIARKMHSGPNPAMKRSLRAILPPQKRTVKNHSAMPFAKVPALMTQLRETTGSMAALALQFTILTACRTGECVGAVWSEIEFDCDGGPVWRVPAVRMKNGREHIVPLSRPTVEILERLRGDDDPDPAAYIFPGSPGKRKGKSGPLSNMAMLQHLQTIAATATTHGFRSSFRDWCGDCTDHPRETVEMCLAHTVGNQVERSYRRSSALDKRRLVMADWANYLTLSTSETTVQIHQK